MQFPVTPVVNAEKIQYVLNDVGNADYSIAIPCDIAALAGDANYLAAADDFALAVLDLVRTNYPSPHVWTVERTIQGSANNNTAVTIS